MFSNAESPQVEKSMFYRFFKRRDLTNANEKRYPTSEGTNLKLPRYISYNKHTILWSVDT